MMTLADFISKTISSIFGAAEDLKQKGFEASVGPMTIYSQVRSIENVFYIAEYCRPENLKVTIIIKSPDDYYININN